jgi:hypothetical protein
LRILLSRSLGTRVLVLFFACVLTLSSTAIPAQATTPTPPWAFVGAFAKYYFTNSAQTTSPVVEGETLNSTGAVSVVYTISAVDLAAQNYTVDCSASGNKTAVCSAPETGSFSGPAVGPVLSPTDLQSMNSGQVPSDESTISTGGLKVNLNVSAGQTVEVPAGTFKVDLLNESLPGGLAALSFYDTNTGLLIKSFSIIDFGTSQLASLVELASTNIAASIRGSGSTGISLGNSTDFVVIVIAVVAMVAVGAAVMLLRRRWVTPSDSSPGSTSQPDQGISK